jgi:DNA-binding transcriptional LysR family regulator
MNLNQLRVFATVAEEGNVTRAARRLAISQPAVSKHLAELERTLQVQLCDRLPRGIRLTDAGRVLHEHAAQLLAVEAAAEADMAALVSGRRGTLSVGASTTIGSYLVPELFGAFKRRYEGVDLELQIANTQAIQAALLAGALDLALTEGFVGAGAVDVEVVAHDEMKIIVAPDHPWAKRRRRLGLDELGEAPIILRERGSGTRDVVEAALAERGLDIEPVMSLGSTEAVKNAVVAGLGVALVSELTVALELATGRLVSVEVEGLKIRRALHLLRLHGRRPSPAAAAFVGLLRQGAAFSGRAGP